MEIQSFFYGLLLFVMFVAFCITSYKHRGLPSVLKPITWYLLIELIGQAVIISMLWWFPKQNRSLPLHIAFPLEAITLLLMYREIFKKYVEEGGKGKYVYRKIFIVLIIAFVLFAIANAICLQPLTIYPNNTRIVLSIMIVIFSIQHHIMITARATRYYYLSGMNMNVSDYGDQKEIPAFKLTQAPMFWITTGLLLFHSFSLFRYIFINVFRKELSEQSLKYILFVYIIFAVMLFVFIAIGIFKAKRIIVVDDESNVDNKQ